MNLSSFIPKIRNRLVFFLMSSCDVKLTIKFRLDLNFWKKVFVTSFELIEPLYCMFMDNIKTIVSSLIFGFSIIGPFVCTGDIDHNPVVFESPHCNICQNHWFSCSSITSQKDIFERWGLIIEISKVRWLRFDWNSFIALKLLESLGKISSRWCDGHFHDFFDFSLYKLERIFFYQMQVLKNRVRDGIRNDWASPNSGEILIVFELFYDWVNVVC